MKRILAFTQFAFAFWPSLAQDFPVLSPRSMLAKNKVKSISIYYKLPDSGTEEIIYRENFDAYGKCLKKYNLLLWHDVTHSITTEFIYDQGGRVVEEHITDQIVDYFPRDSEYILEFGDNPLYQKNIYGYNSAGLLSQKSIFISSAAEPSTDETPAQVITYHWKDSTLVVEKSISPDQNAFNKNYEIVYRYEDDGRLMEKSMKYGQDLLMQQNTTYRYDSLGLVAEEVIRDRSLPRNDAHFRYAYETNGLVSTKFKFNPALNEFEEIKSYTYDDHGNAVSGERAVTFTYYDNGLISTERWIDDITDVEILLSTSYEYFDR